MKSRRIGITGSNGFIGNHLERELNRNSPQDDIIPFDPRKENVPLKLDLIYHLGFNSPTRYESSMFDARSEDLKVAEKIADYCQTNKTDLIFTSSSAVYEPSPLPVKENGKINPVSFYGKAKYEIEQLFTDYSYYKTHSLIILRLFNPFGPGQSKNFVINQIIDAFRKNNFITIQQPNSVRDFIYIGDCVTALLNAAKLYKSKLIINVGTGEKIKIIDLVKIVGKIFRKQYEKHVKINHNSFSLHPSSIANIDQFKKLLHIDNFTSLKSGLEYTVKCKIRDVL